MSNDFRFDYDEFITRTLHDVIAGTINAYQWNNMPTISNTCFRCNTEHDMKSEDFISFHGNVHLGIDGGLIGNNIGCKTNVFKGKTGMISRISICCKSCFCNKIAKQWGEY